MYRILFSFIGLLLTLFCHAQKFVADAPSYITNGQHFRLTYTVSTQDVSSFEIGKMPEGMEILSGPNSSRQSSFQMINGKTTSSSSITYTYILYPTKNGTFTLPAASINANGKSLKSNTVKVTVSGNSNQNQSHSNSGSQSVRPSTNKGQISPSNLFIKVTANKKKVYEQEPILLTYKVYTTVGLTQLDGKMPDLKGFHTQEIQLPQEKSFKVENVNGQAYKTVTCSQYVMFPQMTGNLEIPSIVYNGIVVLPNPNFDPFDIFDGGSGYVEVKKQIKAPSINIEVMPLPERPGNFSGGVGDFDVTAQLDKTEVKANDPITLKVKISGVGNLKLIKEPKVDFPKDFDVYDAKLTENTKLTTRGAEGSITYEFLAVPRHQGKFEIPEIEFVYYDTSANDYKTLRTQSFDINVLKGAGVAKVNDFTGQEDLKLLNSDIRHIKMGNTPMASADSHFFDSAVYWSILCVIPVLAVVVFFILRRNMQNNLDIVKTKGKKANKVAVKRLKQAAKLLTSGKANELYDEVLRALWGYIGDKLNIPVEQLSRDNICQKLETHDISTDTINRFIGALDECEYARYAPGDATGNMKKTYDAAMLAITDIENSMKNNNSRGRQMALLALTFLLPLSLHAITKAEADSAYINEDYKSAIAGYESLLKSEVSSELYYNLGNAYYRIDNITNAIVNYERALLLSPGDKDIRFNLQLARSKTIDKIVPESEMFFVTWYKFVVNIMGVDQWAFTAIITLIIAAVLLLLYFFSPSVGMRKAGFYGGILLLFVFVMCNVFAYEHKDKINHRSGAIIVSSAISIKSTPAKNGTDLFVLHEGTRVEIVDDSMSDWKEIKLADGKEGWVETKHIVII